MNQQRLLKILLSPLITEKANLASKNNQYVFKVDRKATKPDIKAAVEKSFDVKVISVQVVNLQPKRVRFGKTEGVSKGVRKAYVRLAEGNKIDFMSAQA